MIQAFGITIVGAGRVGWHLAQALSAAGHTIHEVWSRRQSSAEQLVLRLSNASVAHSLDFSQSPSQLFLLTVADSALEEMSHRLILPEGAIVAHTSGSQTLDVLPVTAKGTGIFYPLQTFSKEKNIDLSKVPFFIEGSDSATTLVLEAVARSLSDKVQRSTPEQRRQLHLAAVFACNFSNHMLRIAEALLAEHELPAAILHPLIEETMHKAMSIGPAQAQTGPALRGDTGILEQHQKLLIQHPEWLRLYQAISEDIQKNKLKTL